MTRTSDTDTGRASPRTPLYGAARRVLSTSESLLLALAPHGGQRTARHNALVAVRSDTVAARQRADALASIIPTPLTGTRLREPAAS